MLPSSCLCRKLLETCGEAETQLALELSQHEVLIEKEVVDPLYSIAEVGAGAWAQPRPARASGEHVPVSAV